MSSVNVQKQRYCRRCLLRDYDEQAYRDTLEEYIDRLGGDLRTEDSEYNRRLGLCTDCDDLNRGTCMACGCYVELRAAAKTAHCPKKKW